MYAQARPGDGSARRTTQNVEARSSRARPQGAVSPGADLREPRTGIFVSLALAGNDDKLSCMSETDVAEILKLPVEERLRLVELIWESLSATPAEVPLSDAHRDAIDEELADYKRDPNDTLTLEQILAEVRRAR